MALNTIQTAQRTGFEGCHGAQDLRVNMTLLSANGDDAFTPFWSFVLLLFSFVHRSYLQRPEVGSTDHWMERKEHAWTERKRWNRYTKSMKRMKDRLRMCFRGCGFSIWGGGVMNACLNWIIPLTNQYCPSPSPPMWILLLTFHP